MWFAKNSFAMDEKAASQMVKYFHRELLGKTLANLKALDKKDYFV
jgi:hypothetical protein